MTATLDSLISQDLSLEETIALLPENEQEQVLQSMDLAELRWSWRWTARPKQLEVTEADTRTTLYLGGRGAGKTRTGSEWVREHVRKATGAERTEQFALVARTAPDYRDTMINGESGLVRVFPPSEEPRYIASQRKVEFAGGRVTALCFTAEEPAQLRGPAFHKTWADELAAWSHRPDDSGLTAWDNVQFATRSGDNPQILATTTPKRHPLVRQLVNEGRDPLNLLVRLVVSRTLDNRHLSQNYMDTIVARYKNTRLAAQELDALVMEDVEGAQWTERLIEASRIWDAPTGLPLRVIGVDPSVAENPGDECGIIAVGATANRRKLDRHAYVLEDFSLQAPPSEWAEVVVKAARKYQCSVVAETNNGGALVKMAIAQVDPTIRVRTIHARQSKTLRAEPVAMTYDQGRTHHVGRFVELEEQQTSWVVGDPSPDRLDALVYAVAALIVPYMKAGLGGVRISSPARGLTIPLKGQGW